MDVNGMLSAYLLGDYRNSLIGGYGMGQVWGSDFSGVLSRVYSQGRGGAGSFEDAFPLYDVTTHVGSPMVSSADWQRNDFPFWEYFDGNASADCLNNWKSVGANPSQTDAKIQSSLNRIGAGKMAVLIPEKLQEKMNADESYAREVTEKVQKWKADYDRRDNVLAASYGYNVATFQAGKSYCIRLDENGNVANATVTGSGGRTTGASQKEIWHMQAESAPRQRQQKRTQERQQQSHFAAQQSLTAQRFAYFNGAFSRFLT